MASFQIHSKLHERIIGFFRFIAHQSIRHPWAALIVAAVVTAVAGAGLPRLTLRTDGHALISPDSPEVLYDKSIRERFKIEDQIVVLIRSHHPDGVFNPATLELVRQLTAKIQKIPGINSAQVLSLATEPSFRFRPGTLIHQKLLDPPMQTKAELDLLREDLRRIELYTGTLLSTDGRSTALMLGTPTGADRTQLYEQVLDCIAACGPIAEDISVTGAPVAEALLGIHILEDLGVPKFFLGTSTRSRTETAEGKMPKSLNELRLLIARRIGLIFAAVLVMLVVFFLSFRNWLAALLPLPDVAATLLVVFGLMGWLGVPVYLTIAVMPVLLTVMCVTDEIHLFSRYFTLRREKPVVYHVELVKTTVDELASPVTNTTLTTAIGFLSFAFSPLQPVQAFGIFTSLGVLFSLFYSLTVIPAMLTLVKPELLVSGRRKASTGGGRLARWFSQLAGTVVHQRWWVLALLLTVTALTPWGMRRLVIQDSWIDGFDPDSEFRRATQLVNEQFYGMHLLLLTLDAPAMLSGEIPSSDVNKQEILLPANLVENPALIAGSTIDIFPAGETVATMTNSASSRPWRTHIEMTTRRGDRIVARFPHGKLPEKPRPDWSRSDRIRFEIVAQTHLRPDIIQAIGGLGSFVRERKQDAVGGVLSPYDYILTTRFMARPNDPEARQLPDDAGEIKTIWDYYGLARGRLRLRQIVDTNYWQSVTTVFLKDANFVDTARLMSDIRAYEHEHLSPKGMKLGFAGDVAVSQSLIKGIVTTQLQSLCWALAGIYLMTALFGGSLRSGLYCVLPSTLAVLINFAVMGWFGIPLGVATSMFAGMTLGIGVDFAIHVVEGNALARSHGVVGMAALQQTMGSSGPAVFINTIAIVFGFGVMLLSQVPANARLGLLLVLGMTNCLIASLLLLPLLLHWWPLNAPRDRSRASL